MPVFEWALSGNISFLAADFVEKIPIVGFLVKASDGLFCPRGGSTEAK